MKLTPKVFRTIYGQEFHVSQHYECGIPGYLVYENRNGREFVKYRVFSLDVWGNEKDGFEVNDRSECGEIYLPEQNSTAELVAALKEKDLIGRKRHVKSFSEHGDETVIYVDWARNGYPLFQLERA